MLETNRRRPDPAQAARQNSPAAALRSLERFLRKEMRAQLSVADRTKRTAARLALVAALLVAAALACAVLVVAGCGPRGGTGEERAAMRTPVRVVEIEPVALTATVSATADQAAFLLNSQFGGNTRGNGVGTANMYNTGDGTGICDGTCIPQTERLHEGADLPLLFGSGRLHVGPFLAVLVAVAAGATVIGPIFFEGVSKVC